MVKKIAIAALAALAGAALYAAPVKVATQQWVLDTLRKSGVDATTATTEKSVVTNVTSGVVSTNYTITSAFSDTNLPNCVSITLVFEQPKIARTVPETVQTKPSLLSLFWGTAYAQSPDGYLDISTLELKLVLTAGRWTDAAGVSTPFNFGGSVEFRHDKKMPELPPENHECPGFDNDCNCLEAFVDPNEIVYPDEYVPIDNLTIEFASMPESVGDWIDEEHWGGGTARLPRGGTRYFLYSWSVDQDGNDIRTSIAMENLAKSDVWKKAVKLAFEEANEYLGLCRDNYANAHVCDKDNPQHQGPFTSWSGWQYAKYRKYCTRTCKNGHTDKQDIDCPHAGEDIFNREYLGADFSTGKIRYLVTCKCTYQWTEEIDLALMPSCDAANGIHIPKPAVNGVYYCGCACGHYDNNTPADNEDFHAWASAANCTCKCGGYHKGIAPTTYDLNNGNAPPYCRGICKGGCNPAKLADANGLAAKIPAAGKKDHQPCDYRYRRCGCRCGKFLANDFPTDVDFHVQIPGDCRCYGLLNSGGGDWHFPMDSQSDCPSICTGTWGNHFDGKQHIKTNIARNTGVPTVAQPDDHTPKTSMSCGCKCGGVYLFERQEWAGVEKLHKWNTTNGNCICVCGYSPKHKPIRDDRCPDACQGYALDYGRGCPGTYSGVPPLGEVKHVHKPSTTECGCACGMFDDSDYSERVDENIRFHAARDATIGCLCQCKEYHRFSRKQACSKICGTCRHYTGKGWVYDLDGASYADHTLWKTPAGGGQGRCGCQCGDLASLINNEKANVKSHREAHYWPNTKCMCECEDLHREHYDVYYTEREANPPETWTCESCNKEFKKWIVSQFCRRQECYLPDGLIATNVEWRGEHEVNCGATEPEHPNYSEHNYCPTCGCACQENGAVNHGRSCCPGCNSKCTGCTDGREAVEEETAQTTDNPAESGGGTGGGGLIPITR